MLEKHWRVGRCGGWVSVAGFLGYDVLDNEAVGDSLVSAGFSCWLFRL